MKHSVVEMKENETFRCEHNRLYIAWRKRSKYSKKVISSTSKQLKKIRIETENPLANKY